MQNYESGRDRVAAGTLHKIGKVLGIHPGEFFGETAAPVAGVADLREAMIIAAAGQKITDMSVRKRFVALIEELAGHDMALANGAFALEACFEFAENGGRLG